jgi:NADPH-dependent glutamate synthase beta subunit-like oxidoreductase
MIRDFAHCNAKTVQEAVRLLAAGQGRARLNAGGTDLLGVLKDRIEPDYPESVINIKTIRGLNYIKEDPDGLRIGALTRLAELVNSPVVREKYSIITQAAGSVATPQIRNMCTIGGNIAQGVRCWYYRYPDEIGGTVVCLRKGGAVCNALVGDNRYHLIFGAVPLPTYPCVSACPAKTAIPSCLGRVRDGEFGEAARIFFEFNPVPAITGRVCPAFCEQECKRSAYDRSVDIRNVERAIGDYVLDAAADFYAPPEAESGRTVAVVGSGPSGLVVAYYLRRAGHRVTVFERFDEAGGMLRYSIPGYRLPKEVVRAQVKALERMGVVFTLTTEIGKDLTVEELRSRFDAVLVATGAWEEKSHIIRGNARIASGLQFLKDINAGAQDVPGKKVAVIGGGNVAIDVARTLRRLGAKPVVLYRRTAPEMPAFAEEVEKARAEGVSLRFLTLPLQAAKTTRGISLDCIRMKLGDPDRSGRRQAVPREGSGFTLVFDAVINAIGEEPDRSLLPLSLRKTAAKGHVIGANIYGAGDFVTGSSTVVEAVNSGREAARIIDRDLGGQGIGSRQISGLVISSACQPAAPPVKVPGSLFEHFQEIDAENRPDNANALAETQKEAGRCFNCGCVAVSPSDVGVALVAADAKIVTTKRHIDASAFFAPDALNSTVLDTDEMITEIFVPEIPKGARQQYLKFTVRKPVDFAIVSVASIIVAKDGRCSDARIALGAVAPAPFRAVRAEQLLVGTVLNRETASIAAEAAVEGAIPLSRNGYKVQITKALVKRAILGKV